MRTSPIFSISERLADGRMPTPRSIPSHMYQMWGSGGFYEPLGGIEKGRSVELAYVDRGYTGDEPVAEAETRGIRLQVVKHLCAKKGFVLLPRRWVVERSFAWASRFRRLAKDYERLPETVARLYFVAFACLFLHRAIGTLGSSP